MRNQTRTVRGVGEDGSDVGGLGDGRVEDRALLGMRGAIRSLERFAYGVGIIASNTVREGRRQRLLLFIALLAVALVLGARSLRDFNFGASEAKFVADFGFGAMSFFGAALTIVATSQLFFSEIEHRTVLTLIAKPVGRGQFVVGKYLGVAILTAVFCGVLTTTLLLVMRLSEVGATHGVASSLKADAALAPLAIVVAGAAQWLKLLVLSAFTMVIASFARSQLFATAIGFAVLVSGHLQFILQNTAERGGAVMTRVAAFIVAHAVPDFQLFDLTTAIGDGGRAPLAALLTLSLYAAMYVIGPGILAVIGFRRREF